MAVSLLKFDADGQKPVLDAKGIELLQSLPGPICTIAFVGEGRSGKSFLASKLCGQDGVFAVDDSSEAVTEGIDIFAVPLQEACGGHILVFDCEGGNNALAKTRAIVGVVAALVATSLVFVADSKASESSLEALGVTLKERCAIKVDGTGSLAAQHLHFVVNQNRLRYDENGLEKILAVRHDEFGTDLREAISIAYPEARRHFFTVPLDHKPDFEAKLTEFIDSIKASMHPICLGEMFMNGEQLSQTLIRIECEIGLKGTVSLSSLHRRVFLDSILKPTIQAIMAEGFDKVKMRAENYQAKVGTVRGDCQQCPAKDAPGWKDPDIMDFFCEQCWVSFSPKVLKCGFCKGFQPWPLGRVEAASEFWHCIDCLMQLGIHVPEYEGPEPDLGEIALTA